MRRPIQSSSFSRRTGFTDQASANPSIPAGALLLLLIALLCNACSHKQTATTIEREVSRQVQEAQAESILEGKVSPQAPRQEKGLVWERIRAGLRLEQQGQGAQEKIEKRVRWFAKNAEFLEKASKRAMPYLPYIVDEVEKRGMPMEVALLPFIESGFQPFARSPMRAVGIWQFIPSTGKIYGLPQGYWYEARQDIREATRAALDYLQKIHGELEHDWLLAFAAYNSGERRLAKLVRKNRALGKGVSFWDLRPYLPRETRHYVPSLLAVSAIIADPQAHGVDLAAIPDRPYFEEVPLPGQFDLAYAAELADVQVEEIYTLNPAFKRWSSPPQGPHRLLLPAGKGDAFLRKTGSLTQADYTGWNQYVARRGDNVKELAALHGLETSVLAKINGFGEKERLASGTRIKIPAPKYPVKRYASARYDRYSGPRVAGWEQGGASGGVRHVHIVRRGDSLWRIARRYKTDLSRLRLWNPRLRGNLLRPGQRLVVWRPANLPAEPSPQANFHVVRRGESLWLIARRYRLPLLKLRRWNDIPTSNFIYAGQRLWLHAPQDSPNTAIASTETTPAPGELGRKSLRYVVRKGDSLWLIAQRYQTSVANLLRWNRLKASGRYLLPGQNLKIYSTQP